MKKEKLPLCRICLVENVRMYVVADKNLQELYEKLTDIPLVTEDSRPMLACFFCNAKLKQSYRLQRKCLEAEKIFAQMFNEDYETKPQLNQDDLEFNEYIISPTVHISIFDECQTEGDIKQESLTDCEGRDDENQTESEHEFHDTETHHSELDDIPPLHSVSADDVPLNDFKKEVEEEHSDTPTHLSELIHFEADSDDNLVMKFETEEEQVVSKNKRKTIKTKRAPSTKKQKLDKRRAKPKDLITNRQKKTEQADVKIFRNTQNRTSKPVTQLKKSFSITKRQVNRTTSNTDTGHCSDSRNDFTDKIYRVLEQPYNCDQCQRSFIKYCNFKKHIRVHTGETPYKCEICKRNFSDSSSFLRHNRLHIDMKPYICDYCELSFSSKGNLTNHIRVHTDEKPYKCDICQHAFRRKLNLKIHVRVHTGEKPYVCEICQRSFSDRGNFTRHYRLHEDLKPYICDYCQRSFRSKNDLIIHIRVHTGEKPYKCKLCQRSFSTIGILNNHIRVHTSEKPYKCEICARSFTEKSHLTRHFRLHTGERPFKCEICQHCFSDKSNMQKHVRLHTGEKYKKQDKKK